jgi:hypothetical protein
MTDNALLLQGINERISNMGLIPDSVKINVYYRILKNICYSEGLNKNVIEDAKEEYEYLKNKEEHIRAGG